MPAPSETRGSTMTVVADGAIGKHLRIKITGLDANSGRPTVDVADKTETWHGTADDVAFAAGDVITMRLKNSPGTTLMIADAASTAGARVYGTDGGKVNDTDPTSGVIIGTQITTATANNDRVEVLLD